MMINRNSIENYILFFQVIGKLNINIRFQLVMCFVLGLFLLIM